MVLLLARVPRTGRLDRAFTVPVMVAVTGGVSIALAIQGTLLGTSVTLDDVLLVYFVQGFCATTLPIVFLFTALRARLSELTVVERMHRLTAPVSVAKVRDALRSVLGDGTLDLWLWDGGGYVGVDGRPVDAPLERGPGAGGTRSARPGEPSPPSTSPPRSAATSRSSRRR